MNKSLLYVNWIFLSFFLLYFTVANAGAEPTRYFSVEKAEVAEPKTLSIDVGPSSSAEIRAHLIGGEVVVSRSFTGYKYVLQPNLAVFGKVSLDTDTDNTSTVRGGAAYDIQVNEMISLGINAEVQIGTDSNSGIISSVGGYFEIPKTEKFGARNLQVGVEVGISITSDTEAGALIGVRWSPISQATIDFMVFDDLIQGNGGGLVRRRGLPNASIQTPASIRVNLIF